MKKLLCVLLAFLLLIPGAAPGKAEEGALDFAVLSGLREARELLDSGEVIEKVYYTDGYGFSISEFTTVNGEEIDALWKAVNGITIIEKTNQGITDWYPQIVFFFSDESRLNICFDAHWLEVGMDHYVLGNDEAFWNLTASLTAAYAAEEEEWEPEGEDYYSSSAVTVDGVEITPRELETAMRSDLFLTALRMSSYGQEYDTVDRDNIIDTLDKVLFDLEIRAVIRDQAEQMGLDELTAEEYEALWEESQAEWMDIRSQLYGDNAMAYLPAGAYRMIKGDPEGNITRYLASFGVTEYTVFNTLYDQLLEQKLKDAVAKDMEAADQEEAISVYTDWILERFDEAEIIENGVGIAEVCFRLIP